MSIHLRRSFYTPSKMAKKRIFSPPTVILPSWRIQLQGPQYYIPTALVRNVGDIYINGQPPLRLLLSTRTHTQQLITHRQWSGDLDLTSLRNAAGSAFRAVILSFLHRLPASTQRQSREAAGTLLSSDEFPARTILSAPLSTGDVSNGDELSPSAIHLGGGVCVLYSSLSLLLRIKHARQATHTIISFDVPRTQLSVHQLHEASNVNGRAHEVERAEGNAQAKIPRAFSNAPHGHARCPDPLLRAPKLLGCLWEPCSYRSSGLALTTIVVPSLSTPLHAT
ncbi:hypothetical protein NMY22_g2675 [Coprinellus aureogranulatus]|nr:hypothetical protein NMY22_g2675 [Coprinellus aureogranulatus]